MVVYDLDIVSVAFLPTEAYPVLVIYANAVLTRPIFFQGFQPVARRDPQVH